MRVNRMFITGVMVVLTALGGWYLHSVRPPAGTAAGQEIRPVRGTIERSFTSMGTVQPRNRLEVKPPVNGRVDEVLVREGDMVTQGQIVAWMSSTERAALLDAARGEGEDALTHWQNVYKGIPLTSPIDGEVIVARVQPGQTITSSDAVIVVSDRLIVKAQVDETDVSNISVGRSARIRLDAYPDDPVPGGVTHLYYESLTVNNVTMYEVDVQPDYIPPFFRSGMNASVDFILKRVEDVLMVPVRAVFTGNEEPFVMVKARSGAPRKQPVVTGVSDGKNTEIISGLNGEEVLIAQESTYKLPQQQTGTNPFMPARGKRKEGR